MAPILSALSIRRGCLQGSGRNLILLRDPYQRPYIITQTEFSFLQASGWITFFVWRCAEVVGREHQKNAPTIEIKIPDTWRGKHSFDTRWDLGVK